MILGMARRTRSLLLWVLAIGVIAAAGWLMEQRGETLTGTARIADGDSLRIGQTQIRLYGIDAPELAQTCQRNSRTWHCGEDATQALRSMTDKREVVCRARDRDRFGRTVATCYAGGLDLGAAMIRGGWAVSLGAYDADEREARDARRGIWSSQFERPGAWRAQHPRSD